MSTLMQSLVILGWILFGILYAFIVIMVLSLIILLLMQIGGYKFSPQLEQMLNEL